MPFARCICTIDLTTPTTRPVRTQIWEVPAHVIPEALIVARSAGQVMFEGDTLFLASSSRTRDLLLPGLLVAAVGMLATRRPGPTG